MWANALLRPDFGRWAPHLSVFLVTILFARAAVITPEGEKNGTNTLSEEPQIGYPGVNSVAPGPLAHCNNYYSDIVFVVDSTPTYMNEDFWKKVKEFLAEVSIVLGAGLDDRIRLGMVVYGENYSQVFSLNNFTESSEIAQSIRNAERQSDNDTVNITNILHGLHDDIFTYDNGARMFLPHQAVIFTTPVMQNQGIEEDIIKEIAMVHDAGIETYSIAVEAEADFENAAKLLASPPREAGKNYWYLKHYGNLDMSLVTDLAAELCSYNRDTSITFSRSYAPTNGRNQYNQQNIDEENFRAAQPNDEEYDRRQQNNFGGPPVIRNDDNFDNSQRNQRNHRNDDRGRDDREQFQEPPQPPPRPPPRQERPPPREERPPPPRRQQRPRLRGRPSNRPRGPGPRIGASYRGPPPRKDGGGNGPPPPGGQGPGGGQGGGPDPGGQQLRAGGVGTNGGRAPQTHSGYVPIGGFAFGGHDGFRGPNRSPQGVPLRGVNGYGYGGHDGFVGYGNHAFGYGSAGVRGPVFGPRAPVYRRSKTRAPKREQRKRKRPSSEELENQRQRRPPPEDNRDQYNDRNEQQQVFRPPPPQQQQFRPPPRDDRENFRPGPPQQRENSFRPPPPRQENFRPPPPQDNFRPPPPQQNFRPPPPGPPQQANFRDDNRNQENFQRRPQEVFRPPPPQDERGNFRNNDGDNSQHQNFRPNFQNGPPPREENFNRPPPRGENFNRPPPREENFNRPPPNNRDFNRPPPREEEFNRPPPREQNFNGPPPREEGFNRPPPPQQSFNNRPPPPHPFQNQGPPPPLPRGRFQDNRPPRPQGNFQPNSRHDNNRARDESPQDDESSKKKPQDDFPPPQSFVRAIAGFNSPANPHNVFYRHPNNANYNQRPPPNFNNNEKYRDDGAGDGPNQGNYNQGQRQNFQPRQPYQPQQPQQPPHRQNPGPQYTQGGQQGQGPEVHSYSVKGKDEFEKGRSYGKEYKKEDKYDEGGLEAPKERLRYSETRSDGSYENFKGYDQYYGFEDHVKERGEDVGRVVKEAVDEYNNDQQQHHGDNRRNYDVPPKSKELKEKEDPKVETKKSEGSEGSRERQTDYDGKVRSPYPGGYRDSPEGQIRETRYPNGEVRVERLGKPLYFDARGQPYPPPPPPPGLFPIGVQQIPEVRRQEGNIYGSREVNEGQRPIYGSREGGINAPRQQPNVFGSREVYGSREVNGNRATSERRRPNEQTEPRPPPFNPYIEGQSDRRPFYPYPPHSGDPRRPVEIYRYRPIIGRPPASYETLRNQPSYFGTPEIHGRLASPGIPIYKVQNRRRPEGVKSLNLEHLAKDVTRGGAVVAKKAAEPEIPKPTETTEPPKAKTEAKTEQQEQPRAARLSAAAPQLDENVEESISSSSGSTITIAAVAGVLGTILLAVIVVVSMVTARRKRKQHDAEMLAASRQNRFFPPNHLPFNSMSSKFAPNLDIDEDAISTVSSAYSLVAGHGKKA